MSPITIRKADGSSEVFQSYKLRQSLKRSGASDSEVASIVHDIEQKLYDGITTEKIYRDAFELLRQSEKTIAARYSLRRAMIGLGPTGFPFEDYLARLFQLWGYETKTRLVLQGQCVSHEIDVLAHKDTETLIAEAKFHMQPGIKSDVQVVLYSYARFLDILKNADAATRPITNSWVITNTKFTTTAIEYGRCVGMNLLSWDYPKKGNLQDIIEETKMYPITVLQSLSEKEKRALLSQGTVLCTDILDNEHVLGSANISRKKQSAVLDEGARICTIR